MCLNLHGVSITKEIAKNAIAPFHVAQSKAAAFANKIIGFLLRRSPGSAVWAATRIGRANPYHKKHEPRALKGELTVESNPAYFQLQEEYEEWTRKIEGLWPQQAYIKYNRNIPKYLRRWFRNTRTLKIKIVTIPAPKTSAKDIQKIKDWYTKTLMTPVSEMASPIIRVRKRKA